MVAAVRILDTVREKIRLAEAELLRRLASAPDRTVPAIADHVFRRQGITTVAALSAASGFTRQRLARKFRHALGVSPKLFCRLVPHCVPAPDRSAGSGLRLPPASFLLLQRSHVTIIHS